MKKLDDELLDATQRVINSRGVAYLTIENVAKEAGVSKGGLLYHFPSKNALIQGVIKEVLERYAEGMENINEKDVEKGHFIRSYAEASLNNPQQLKAGLLAAIATDQELLKPVQEFHEEWQEKIEDDGLDPILATIYRLIIDGLWFNDIFDLAPPKGELRRDVLDRFDRLTREK
ncbi:TetR/AcrR family transcriptional regulator [Natribacillus halophilus]|uniref:DNA-binding transcriptional regulator, AcrR family n=1 Tax=Natribacillus halophilus TaxID=549003 RepID=A0A1G8SH17_9BACI|nr:TetR/AcrR family transcriptional regulator [Natribacillus halophilus]SDJ28552.1 DNA-binding transcriptional regulator, AcrR family [Natribacillus halophilus]